MGSSKGVLLSGIALIIGMYAVGIKKADAIIASSAGTRVYQLQSDANARTGLRIAIDDMTTGGWSTRPGMSMLDADTISYQITNIDANHAKVSSTGRFKGVTTTIIAYVEKTSTIVNRRGRRIGYNWAITKSYLVPSTDTFITQ